MFDFEKNGRLNYLDDTVMEDAHKKIVKHYSSSTGRELLHLYLVACMHHAVKNNSADRFNRLWTDLPVNAPHKLMADWAMAFTPLKRMKDKSGQEKWLSRDDKGGKTPMVFNLSGEATPFYSMPKAGAAKHAVFDPEKSLQKWIDKVDGAEPDAIDKELAEGVAALLKAALTKREQIKSAPANENKQEEAPIITPAMTDGSDNVTEIKTAA